MLQLRSLDMAVAAILFLLGLYVMATSLGLGFLANGIPDSGFFPFFMGLGLSLFSAINAVRIRSGAAHLEGGIAGDEILRVVLSSLALTLFALLSAPIGLLPAGFLLMLSLAVIFGARTPPMILRATLAAAVMTGVLYLIFVRLLGIVAP